MDKKHVPFRFVHTYQVQIQIDRQWIGTTLYRWQIYADQALPCRRKHPFVDILFITTSWHGNALFNHWYFAKGIHWSSADPPSQWLKMRGFVFFFVVRSNKLCWNSGFTVGLKRCGAYNATVIPKMGWRRIIKYASRRIYYWMFSWLNRCSSSLPSVIGQQ